MGIRLLGVLLLTWCGVKSAQVISDNDLSTIATTLWNSDSNAAIEDRDFRLNLQRKITSYNSRTDLASSKLFSSLDEKKLFAKPTYAKFIALLNNYIAQTGRTESVSSTEQRENEAFLDEVLKTTVMQEAWKFLQTKGYSSSSATGFKGQLRSIWFTAYSRAQGRQDTSGFEHVFVGEIKNNAVTGLHNWIQFYLQEKAGQLNYYGYFVQRQLEQIKLQYKWLNTMKAAGSMFVGTSPEFEIALYTVCFLTRPDQPCEMRINGNYLRVITYDVSYITNKKILASAYPDT
ncbi:poly(U)-specific endoribonuclease-C [Lingula anatina]|uniref:Uridylate-specific endoribonuclease n=1 Tax=Lingula anatina TaxID=7574 RepID=A0A1S3IER2_LINAN|nr:poly(U)-specific endoribonuclease-C [Lingula anatina]|eukprot:XP_013396722.1 poly(U)-specific endoribonuclease-C [Lingula anatina]